MLRAKGRTVDSDLIPYPFAIVGTFWGGCFGWLFGWALTAFLPRKRIRTRRDYLSIVGIGLFPLCLFIAAAPLGHHLLR